tara:strand:- start:30 stop:155 length:126 start_codon:yes stop_codon:yes gene_type:complete
MAAMGPYYLVNQALHRMVRLYGILDGDEPMLRIDDPVPGNL